MVSFGTLWTAHPINGGIDTPCATNGHSNFENQCAIRMSVALAAVGVSLSNFRGARCWFGHSNHILRAQELADWLNGHIVFGTPTVFRNTSYTSFVNSGIVFFKNFYGVGNQGDHIDLWTGSYMTKGDPDYFARSQEAWFWQL